ncbi:hypothetical protein [Kordiimonas sp.]|uniref:hypothetical protein n=1 Tax=Kordiimonas sp. TaxID=1970157 RepID=UPI003A912B02
MKAIHLAFAFLLAIASITIFILLSDPPPGAVGVAHETISGMKLGGDGAARLATVGLAPFYFQIAVIAFAGTLLYMGIAERRRDTTLRLTLATFTGVAMFVWYMLYSGYEAYLETGQTDVVFGFPVPVTWMFWGIWGSFVVFDLFYVFAFRRYFLPAEDEAAFHALVEELKVEERAE